MLKMADYRLSEEIFSREAACSKEPQYAFLFPYGYRPEVGFQSNVESITQASMDADGNVIGFINSEYDHDLNAIVGVTMVNFSGKPSIAFGKDVLAYFRYIFEELKIDKVDWYASAGTSSEGFNDNVAKMLGGRVVGVLRKNSRDINGKFYDTKIYEAMKEDYFSQKEKGILR